MWGTKKGQRKQIEEKQLKTITKQAVRVLADCQGENFQKTVEESGSV